MAFRCDATGFFGADEEVVDCVACRVRCNDMSNERDVAAIREVIAAAGRFQNDVEPFLALHTEDAVIVNIAGIRVLGRQALREAMTRALETHLANVLTTIEVLDVRFATPDVAIVSCVKHVRDENPDSAGALPSRGSLTYVVVRRPEGWRIALAQTTPQAT